MSQQALLFGSDLEAAARQFHEENPDILELFERFTFEAIAAGRRHFGAKAIFERIRWYTAVETRSGDGLKLNNNFTAYYARMFHERNPEHCEFFRTRAVKS